MCAIWQTGASWMPPPGAAEQELQSNTLDVMARFGAWLKAFLNSVKEHASNPRTRIAHAGSRHARGQSGLNAEEAAARSWRAETQSNYNLVVGDCQPADLSRRTCACPKGCRHPADPLSAYCDFCFFESPHPENHMCECPCAGCDPPESEPSEGAVAREHLETYAQGTLAVL